VDEPKLPPELHVTTDFAYIRWHGHGTRPWYNYDYSIKELKTWVPKIKEVSEKANVVYAYFNNHFKWQVKKGKSKWGYPGAVKNAIEMLDLLDKATEEQKMILERINKWREEKEKTLGTETLPRRAGVTTLESFNDANEESLGVGDLLIRFMGTSRLLRAEQIADNEIKIQNSSDDFIKADIRRYSIELDLENRIIKHNCSDWIKGMNSKRVCKHVGKLFLLLPRERTKRLLKDIWINKDKWKFSNV
jgi:hypothetical protein